ncbi:hypothetical protein KD909_03265 [Exiguobacterium sp. PFWT01]|uniref:Ig-like domain-containing protein n=1 Tax=Exiguobacterium sp. PFWT01 TaxID=2829816 RepID=UPI001BA94A0B|nr:Ig-like domain-containing protein [Exiguobacterium sp. PFWT01]QUP87767.1 hypothetical protein KD909_03265 [Exiguobacterium sp. PFWT01]
MKQPKFVALFLTGALVFSGIAPSYVAAETDPVAEDVTAPAAPVVSVPLDTSTSVTIGGEVGAKALILINNKTYERVISADGQATFTMAPQTAGKTIDVRLVDGAGNVSDVTQVIVQKTTVNVPTSPKLSQVTTSSPFVELKGAPYAAFELKIGQKTYTGKFYSNGTFRKAIASQKAGSVISARSIAKDGTASAWSKTTVIADKTAPNPGRLKYSVTAYSTRVIGTAEPYTTAIVTIGTKTYSAPVSAKGEFSVVIPRQRENTLLSLVIRDRSGNRSQASTIKVHHAFYNKYYRIDADGARLTLHKEVFASDASTRYAETFAPLFLGHPSKEATFFLMSYYAEDGVPLEFEKFHIRVGSATYAQAIPAAEVGYDEYEDGSVEESYVFKPNAKLIAFMKQHVRLDRPVVITIEGYEYEYKWDLTTAEKRAFIQSLQYAGF